MAGLVMWLVSWEIPAPLLIYYYYYYLSKVSLKLECLFYHNIYIILSYFIFEEPF